jgi:hypothetical protein
MGTPRARPQNRAHHLLSSRNTIRAAGKPSALRGYGQLHSSAASRASVVPLRKRSALRGYGHGVTSGYTQRGEPRRVSLHASNPHCADTDRSTSDRTPG